MTAVIAIIQNDIRTAMSKYQEQQGGFEEQKDIAVKEEEDKYFDKIVTRKKLALQL